MNLFSIMILWAESEQNPIRGWASPIRGPFPKKSGVHSAVLFRLLLSF
jgi:hypothetical protein